jgi:hypothetical protein
MPRRGETTPPLERAAARTIAMPSGCWECDLGLDTAGYPQVRLEPEPGQRSGRLVRVGILVHSEHHGPIPDGEVLRHLCHNRRCVRPEHLTCGSHQQNCDDKMQAGRHAAQKQEACKNGHPRAGIGPCRECQRAAWRAYYHRNRDKVAAARATDYQANPEKYKERNRMFYVKRTSIED